MADTPHSASLTEGPRFGLTRPKPVGAPHVVAIVLDDTGFGQLGCFGSTIETPAIDRLASEGLRFTRFHVTAMCSPTRASFFTGRNAHRVGMGFVADIPLDHPGYTARIPESAATLARHFRDAGWATRAVGKWHLVPRYERSDAGPFNNWPLGLGFERYYGFLLGDTNQWRPHLVEDNHYLDPPASWPENYHLSEDLVDRALSDISSVRVSAPGKPTFTYVAFGAAHAPHHVPKRWIDHYAGKFDQGWDAWRDEVIEKQRQLGIIPDDTHASLRPPWVEAWDSLSDDEKKMHARQQEVFAAFLSHTDEQIGRLLDGLDDQGLSDNTIVMLFSDNGASAEGGRLGSVNEHRFTAHIPESAADNMSAMETWGGPETYNHYSWGWAWAGNAPFRLWKRFTWLGGTRTPLIVRYPPGVSDPGGVRSQITHVSDLAPTLLDLAGIEPETVIDGVTQLSFDGKSLRSIMENPDAQEQRTTQYFELLGSRSIIHNGYKATTNHVPEGLLDEEELVEGSRSFEEDRWELFDLTHDFAEANDIADAHPEIVDELDRVWREEAEANHVLPLFDSLMSRFGALIGPLWPVGQHIELTPGTKPISDEVLPMLFGGFTLSAELSSAPGEGVLCALGDHLGGFALFVSDHHLFFTLVTPTTTTELKSDRNLSPSDRILSISFDPQLNNTLALHIDGEIVASTTHPGDIPVAFQHGGTALRVGSDCEFEVSKRYQAPFPFQGSISKLVLDASTPTVTKMNELLRNALHAD